MDTRSLSNGRIRPRLELLNIQTILDNIPFKRSDISEYLMDPYTVRITRGNTVYDVVITNKVTIAGKIFFEYVEINTSGNLIAIDELIPCTSITEGGDEKGNEFDIPKRYSEVYSRDFPLNEYYSIQES